MPDTPSGDVRLDIPLDADARAVFERSRNALPIMRHLRMKLDLSDRREVVVELTEISDFHRGGTRGASLNCAVVSSLLDCATATAGMLQFPGRICGTVQLSVTIMRPVFGPSVRVVAHALRKAANLAFTHAELLEGDRVSAIGTGIVAATLSEVQAVVAPLEVSV